MNQIQLKSWLKSSLVVTLLLSSIGVFAQDMDIMQDALDYDTAAQQFTIMFTGDIMVNNKQLESAYDEEKGTFDFSPSFKYIQPILGQGDLVIGNLETNFAGPPYSGYPNYSSPDELAVALSNAGFNFLVTANDQAMDNGSKGVHRTLDVLDTYGIQHTGTYMDAKDKKEKTPCIFEKDGFKIAVVSFTINPDNFNVPFDAEVNIMDRKTIFNDLYYANKEEPDFTIVYLHWGEEYKRVPHYQQKLLAKFCFDNGANLVVGSHPHTVQRIEYVVFLSPDDNSRKNGLVAYSLGNFLSDQRHRFTDGGIIMELNLCKNFETNETFVCDYGYIPTWVHEKTFADDHDYYILPVSEAETKRVTHRLNDTQARKMRRFAKDTRFLLSGFLSEVRYHLSDEIVSNVAETIELRGKSINRSKSDIRIDTVEMDAELLAARTGELTSPIIQEIDTSTSGEKYSNDPTYNQKKPTGYTYVKKGGGTQYGSGKGPKARMTISEAQSTVKSGGDMSAKKESPAMASIRNNITDTLYRVEFFSLRSAVEVNTEFYPALKGYDMIQESDGWWHYYSGISKKRGEMVKLKEELIQSGQKKSKVVRFYKGKKVLN